jgi:hypothetical protein
MKSVGAGNLLSLSCDSRLRLIQVLGPMSKSIAVAGILLASLAGVASAAVPSTPLISEITLLTGPNARYCGVVALGEDPTSAWACARAADHHGMPYWLVLQQQGVDSDVWVASLRTPAGGHFILTYDSNYMGPPGLTPRFTRDTCNGAVALTRSQEAPLQYSGHGP